MGLTLEPLKAHVHTSKNNLKLYTFTCVSKSRKNTFVFSHSIHSSACQHLVHDWKQTFPLLDVTLHKRAEGSIKKEFIVKHLGSLLLEFL